MAMLRALVLGLVSVSFFVVSVSATENEFLNCNCDDDDGLWSIHSILECQKFMAFIVLCGLTHLLNGWTYYGPYSSFRLMLLLTVAKFLTALVSCATAIALLPLIPLLLKWKARELSLRQNTLDLDNCAVWMPDHSRSQMSLTHEVKPSSSRSFHCCIPTDDPDVREVKESEGVRILRPDSALGIACGGGSDEAGAVAAIRMPILQGYNFKGGTPESVETCYAILVLVLPSLNSRNWSYPEMEMVEVVADQVAVALSHAAVLEKSLLMREKLGQQNRLLHQEQKNVMMASQARNTFQKVMSHGMKRPMNSILGLLSVFQDENMNINQKTIVSTLVKTSSVLTTLINDVIEIWRKMMEDPSLPDQVIGDEKRTFQVILHMVGYLLDINNGGGTVLFQVLSDVSSHGKNDKTSKWRSSTQDNFLPLKVEVAILGRDCRADSSVTTRLSPNRKSDDNGITHADNSFRVVVLDLHMPEMDGFEVAMRIRKFRSWNWPLIIALTASAEDHVRERCLQMVMNTVIRKPAVLQGMAD
ncbi:Signal transduction histidine kinase isoform 2 [Hibiscus syriacus]|uniref:Signal transduction histidine kinase isoform 2 n=1 Tax=Hibiscus syriacus TaxID=106335 RepID=A0A6A3BUM6_HIBSY|nr:Signal transduction histidine kinase isoform 2 [Hibiscus syriacus]